MEKNQLIAEFMGLKPLNNNKDGWYDTYDIHKSGVPYPGGNTVTQLRFHDSWDWLMPVVEHIEVLCKYIVFISGNSCVIEISESKFGMDEEQIIVDADSKIEAVYGAVVSFIEWWNQAYATSPTTAEKMLNTSFDEPFE